MTEKTTSPDSLGAASCSRVVLQRRYRPSYGIPKTWTEWHDHPEPHQIAWGPGQYATLEENMKAACEGYYSLGQGCEFRMVRRTDETLWEYSANNGLSILHEWEGWADGCAKRARDINEYSPYAELRDAMRKAIAATDEIAKCSPSVRAHIEGRVA